MVNEAKFWQDMPEVQQQLNQIDPIIQDNLASIKGKLGEALRYAFLLAAKDCALLSYLNLVSFKSQQRMIAY